MIKKYRKVTTIKAQQFDESSESINKYNIDVDDYGNCAIPTLEGMLELEVGDWIATGTNGEHWPIKDDIFKKTYKEVPTSENSDLVKAVVDNPK